MQSPKALFCKMIEVLYHSFANCMVLPSALVNVISSATDNKEPLNFAKAFKACKEILRYAYEYN